MKAHIIIQARLGSTRLPGKTLFKVLDKTILEYVIERTKKAKTVGNVIVATTTKKEDLAIVNSAKKLGVGVYRGSEDDVLDRFYQAARLFNVKHIVRITADCPFIDPDIIDAVVERYFETQADYCANTLEITFPDGEDVEVFGFETLKNAWKNARLLSEREHVTPYIEKRPDKFKHANLKNKANLSDKRWTLDTKEDFEFIKTVLASLYPVNPDFRMEDILNFLRQKPHLEKINKNITRNNNYYKALEKDRITNIDYTKE